MRPTTQFKKTKRRKTESMGSLYSKSPYSNAPYSSAPPVSRQPTKPNWRLLPQDILLQLLAYTHRGGRIRASKYIRSLRQLPHPPLDFHAIGSRPYVIDTNPDCCRSFSYHPCETKNFYHFHLYKTLLPNAVKFYCILDKYTESNIWGYNLLYPTKTIYDYCRVTNTVYLD